MNFCGDDCQQPSKKHQCILTVCARHARFIPAASLRASRSWKWTKLKVP